MRVAIVTWADDIASLRDALAVSVFACELWLRAHPDTPRLYESGVRYQRESPTHGGHHEERFLTWPWILYCGLGDCDDLAAARVSELHVTGEDPHAWAEAVEVAKDQYHAVVIRGDGRREDPSAILGMPTR